MRYFANHFKKQRGLPSLLNSSQVLNYSYIRRQEENGGEGGFELSCYCKLMKILYLQLNANNDKDLDYLVSLLLTHDFILF